MLLITERRRGVCSAKCVAGDVKDGVGLGGGAESGVSVDGKGKDGVGRGGQRSEEGGTKMVVQGKPPRELGLPSLEKESPFACRHS